MKNNPIIVILLTAIIAGGAGFFIGMKYQGKRLQISEGRFSQRFPGRDLNRATRGGFRPTTGEIVNLDDKSITLKLPDGSSKIILLSEKTLINKAQKATKNDLKNGEQAVVFGSENSDGSISAQTIQLNPQLLRWGTSRLNQ